MKPANSTWGEYLSQGFGRRLSRLGEKLNIHWLTYNPIHFMSFHRAALQYAPGVMRAFATIFPSARRYVDVGAGTGAFAAEAQRQGRTVIACEHNARGRKEAKKQGVPCVPFDLAKSPAAKIGGPFDLAYCFEVAEHLPPSLGDRLVEFIAAAAPVTIFTAAHPGQGGTGHINEQPKPYWIERFERSGMSHNPALSKTLSSAFAAAPDSADYLVENVLVFERSPNR